MRRLLAGGLLVALVGPLLGAGSRPAAGATTTRLVGPGVELQSFTRLDPALGPQEVRVLRFRLDNPAVRLAPVLAADFGSRRAKVSELVLASGALGAVNGDFFTGDGNVRGIHVSAGRLRSEAEPLLGAALTPRAAWRLDGANLAFGRPATVVRASSGGEAFGLNGVDRALGYLGNPDEAVLETPAFGPVTATPAGGVDVLLDTLPPLTADGTFTATVTEVREGPGPVPAAGGVVAGMGANAAQLRAGLAPGDVVEITLDTDDPGFATAAVAGGGGPWLVHDGVVVPRAAMLGEGFTPTHLDRPAPRTAIARAADGTVLLVTVDGRQPGRSAGATLAGLAAVLVELGATDAIALDGGGSTTMAVDGLLANVPSGEDFATRRPGLELPVAEAVGVFLTVTPSATRRLAGDDRVATAIAVSRERAAAAAAVLATTAGFADALVGGPLAAAAGGPVLLTAPTGLDPRVADELTRLGVAEVVVLGGVDAVGAQVDTDLVARGLRVRRLAGGDRYGTAAEVARAMGPSPVVLVASGVAFPDALAAGALGLPVVLTAPGALPDATRSVLGAATPVVVGGSAAVAEAVLPGALRLAGADRYATSVAVADWGLANGRYDESRLVVARGDDFADALVGGALRLPLLLVGRFGLGAAPATRDWIAAHGPSAAQALVLGGRRAVSTLTELEVDGAVAR